jgi:acetolactate synthase-1/2/3 large subunit
VISPLLGTDAFQESDVMGISMPVTKWNYQITSAEEIPSAIAKAFYIARTGRPGPVMIDLAKNAQVEEFDFSYKKCARIRSYIPYPSIDLKKVEQAAGIINKAEKPLALIGHGVILSGAETELKTFLEKTGIPAAWTLLGDSALPHNHPLNVGMLGMHGNYGPNIKTNECDVLIALGMRFDDRVTGNIESYAKQAKIIHCEIDSSEVDKNIKSDVAIIADLKEILQALIPRVKENSHSTWLAEFGEAYKTEYEHVIQPELYPESGDLTMGEVIRRLNEYTKGDAILVTDVGQHQMVAARYFSLNSTRSLVTSGGLGTMGFGLPASIGAKIGRPDKQVVAIIGDGGFQMTIQELGTIAQSNVEVKIVLMNNTFLGMVRQWQQLFFKKRYSSTELHNPDFITIAQGYRIKGQRVEKRDDLDRAIKDMFNHKGPYLLEVSVRKEGNVFPMVPAGASVSEIRLE